jgi:DNA-binding NarL/FixJ family response regulator
MPLQTILAEDNSAIRESLIPALAELANAEVIAVAETAAEAIAAFHRFESIWQLAILDLFLKDGHGLDVLRSIVKTRADQHVFLLTNYATADIRRRALAAGADGIFDKSTEVEQFFDACKSLSGVEPPR